MEFISEHITYAEAIRSSTAKRLGIDNRPPEWQLQNMIAVAEHVFEPVRNHFGKRIFVSSFYRCPEVNGRTPGSSSHSQHCTGEAMDLDAHVYGGMTNKDIFNYIKDNLDFDQLIWEFGNDNEPDWVHVSFSLTHDRKQVLKSYRLGVSVQYTDWK